MQWIGAIAPPRPIRGAITYTLLNGWDPCSGGDVELGCDTTTDLISLHQRTKGAAPSWIHNQWAADRAWLTHVFSIDKMDGILIDWTR